MASPILPRLDLTGQRFGRYTVVEEAPPTIGKRGDPLRRWVCQCDCGNFGVVQQGSLRNGRSRSCGCLHRELVRTQFTKHGHSPAGVKSTPEYTAWTHMRARCYQPSCRGYEDYGGRGITVCAEWDSFEQFFADMGERPSNKHSIDRIDNNGNYEPGNCRWATSAEQSRNNRRNIYLEFGERRMVLKDWAIEAGISANTIKCRIAKGWSVEKALTTPARGGNGCPSLLMEHIGRAFLEATP